MAITNDYADRIRRLLEERARHAEALVQIEKTLDGIGALLGAPIPGLQRGSPAEATAAEVKKRPRRGRGAYEVTADEFVLDFVRQHKDATTREINDYWTRSGRGQNANNTLGKLVKMKQLKRSRIEGQRGSRYSLA